MKKYLYAIFFLMICGAVCVQNISAQENINSQSYKDPRADRFYFDAGLCIGYLGDTVLTPSLKTGIGPIDSLPLFFVAELGCYIGTSNHGIKNMGNVIFFAGPGAVFYVHDYVQLAGSIGVDIGAELGIAGNISVAFDISREYDKHGVLFGIDLFTLAHLKSNSQQVFLGIGVFLKYTYRTKDWPIFWDKRY
ncbi:hypothetical protein FACS1894102_3920 [Spirochaetia bacterium]|nr:hypothetical protein FACS1894102_3920 [Spirochaetia bacterium]